MDYSQEYLTFTFEDSTSEKTISFTYATEYSEDKNNWTAASGKITFTANKIYLRRSGSTYYGKFDTSPFYDISTNFIASGNIMSLLYGDNFKEATVLPSKSCFTMLFANCKQLYDARNLILPATALTSDCYSYMFEGCANLVSPPKLPATALAAYCYQWMFKDCTSLENAPELPATETENYCYWYMFQGCSKLKEAPQLKSTVLCMAVYSHMFEGCSSLTSAPDLPTPSIMNHSAYTGMFAYCTNLTTAPKIEITLSNSAAYAKMFEGDEKLEDASAINIETVGVESNEYMFRDCTALAIPPTISVGTLSAKYCFREMFKNTKLSSLKVATTAINRTDCLTDWLNGVTTEGVFYKPSGATYTDTTLKLPSTWTVEAY